MKVAFRPFSESTWERVRSLIGDSFFGSLAFAQLWQVRGGRPVCWTVEDGPDLLGVLPGVEFGFGPVKRLYAMPEGCYTRLFLHPDIRDQQETAGRLVLDAIAKRPYAKLHLFDYYHTLPDDSRYEIQPRETTLVDISSPGWEPPDRKLRSEIRKAEREGTRVLEFDWDSYQKEFLDLMRRTERRHGQRPRYSSAFFESLAKTARRDRRIRWVWCQHRGQPVSTHIFFIEGEMLQDWLMYYDKAFSFLKPNQYIWFTLCREMAAQGVRYLNLGATPPGAEGPRFFKRRWGGKPYHYNCLMLKRGLGKLL
ncbi:MAG: GNAT family N-acetyltransferase [Candidatus Zixiibacteriota bacterium]